MSRIIILFILFLPSFCSIATAKEQFRISAVEFSADARAGVYVIKEAYRRLGRDVEIVWATGKEAIETANSGEHDGDLQRIDGISRKFSNLIKIPIPINYLEGAVFTNDETVDVRGWYDLKTYKVGIVKGIIFAEEGTEGMNVVSASTYPELFQMLIDREVDVAVMPRLNGLTTIKQMELNGIIEVHGTLEILFLYHYIHKKHQDLVPELEEVLKSMLLEGTTRRIRDKAHKELLIEE